MTNHTQKQKDLLDAVAVLWNADLIDDKTFKRLNSEIIDGK
jgi:hypothetical protein